VNTGTLTATGALTAASGNFGSGTIQTTGAVNTGTLTATGALIAASGNFGSGTVQTTGAVNTGTLVASGALSAFSLSTNYIQNITTSQIQGPTWAWQYYWSGSYTDGQGPAAVLNWTDNYSGPTSYGLDPLVPDGYVVPYTGLYVLGAFVRTSDNAGTLGFTFCEAGSPGTQILTGGDSTLWIPRDSFNRQSASYTVVTKLTEGQTVSISFEGGGGGSGDIDDCWFWGNMISRL
jgi:hypothetical protein